MFGMSIILIIIRNEKFHDSKILQFFNFKINWIILLGGGQNLERRNVERPIFRNFKIANIKITEDE